MNPQDARDLTEAITLLNQLVSHKASEWLPVYAAIGGAFVGAVATFVPNLIIETYKNKKRRNQIEASLIAEISALVHVIETRRYLDGLRKIAEEFTKNPSMPLQSYTVDVPSHYSRIYQNNCSESPRVSRRLFGLSSGG